MPKPYPGYPPSYKTISKVGNYVRQCLVVELLSIDGLNNVQIAQIKERLEATIADIKTKIPIIERSDIVSQDRFDPVLRQGLRLP